MLNIIDLVVNKYKLNLEFRDYKNIVTTIYKYILNDNTCETITKLLFPVILPLYPVNYTYDKGLFTITDNKFDSYNNVFLRKYKTIKISKTNAVSPVDGLHIETNKCKNNCIYIKDIPIQLNKIFNSDVRLTDNYYYDIIYLRSTDYHYVHFPINCKVMSITNIPGKYKWMEPEIEFGCKFIGSNYRKIYTLLDEDMNELHYLVMIASIIVGGINTIFYEETLNPADFYTIDLSDKNIKVKKGDYLANFYIGSMISHIYPSSIKKTKPFSLDNVVRVGKTISYSKD